MIQRGTLYLFFLVLALGAWGQETGPALKGEVTFLTSKNVYVRFEQTQRIEVGDTLRLLPAGTPCLLVGSKSSTSCVCTRIGECEVQKGSEVGFFPAAKPVAGPVTLPRDTVPQETPAALLPPPEETPSANQENIQGRISVTSYSTLASARDDRNRLMGQFWLDARHIKGSRFSLVAQANYRQVFPANPEKFAPKTLYFNVYNLAVRYDVDPSFSLTLGRRINPKIASLGAIDGLQVEKYFGKFFVGAIAGSRPDIFNYSYNFNLLEFGAYAGAEWSGKNARAQTTLGLIEQLNTGSTDRRYAYLQHSSTLFRRLNLFASTELDLYQSVNGVASNTLRLTNLFASATYRFNRVVNLMLSYDSRKRVLFFESFEQTEIERQLDDDLARQGIRARINLRPVRNVHASFSYARRFQSDQQNQSDNLYGFVSYSRLPWIGGRISLTYNDNKSNYLTSRIISFMYSRPLFREKLDMDLYFRRASYVYVNSELERRQFYYGTNLSLNVNRNWAFRLTAERSDFNQEVNYRIYAGIIRRFRKNK